MNLSPTGYWDLDSNLVTDPEQVFENKSKIYFSSAMCLLNPRQDPTIFGNTHAKHLNATCPTKECRCIEIEHAAGSEERYLKFIHASDNIEVELETQNAVSRQTSIRQTSKLKGEERPYKCVHPGCSKTFLLKHHLASHERTHTGERPHVCVHCGKSFTHKYCLNTHLLLHTHERPHQCTECNKRFTLKHHLMSHINVHKRAKPFSCGECGKSFSLKKQLITHEKYHKGERPFVCKECGDTFAQENHLVVHLRFHGSLTSFVCEECGATFTRKFELNNHERLHGKKPLVCPVCTKEFLQKRTLATHMRTHQTMIVCHFCEEEFPAEKSAGSLQPSAHCCKGNRAPDSTKIELNPKTRIVPKCNKNKKYFCDICFRKFGAKHGLTQHRKRQHNIGGNLFCCHICNKSFREKKDLILHKHNL